MLVKDALKITDSFTKTSKMPGLSYSLPAWECKTGWKLSKVPGTPCFFCYAKKEIIHVTQQSRRRNIEGSMLSIILNGLKLWLQELKI